MAEKRLAGKSVVLVVPKTQFREEEVFEPRRVLEAEGAAVHPASTAAGPCRGMRDGMIDATLAIGEVDPDAHDGLVIAGGASVPALFWKNAALAELVSKMAEAGKVIAAISLSTVVLAKASLLEGKSATVYYLPEAIEELRTGGARYVGDRLIVDGKLIMAEGPAEARDFSMAVAAALAS